MDWGTVPHTQAPTGATAGVVVEVLSMSKSMSRRRTGCQGVLSVAREAIVKESAIACALRYTFGNVLVSDYVVCLCMFSSLFVSAVEIQVGFRARIVCMDSVVALIFPRIACGTIGRWIVSRLWGHRVQGLRLNCDEIQKSQASRG